MEKELEIEKDKQNGGGINGYARHYNAALVYSPLQVQGAGRPGGKFLKARRRMGRLRGGLGIMERSESIAALAKALIAFQREINNPKNTTNNDFYKSKYAPLGEVLNLVRPILAKNDLCVMQNPSSDGNTVTVKTILLHASGEWIETDPLVLKPDKQTPQSYGSAITYGRRYSISALLGICSEDDDDGNSSSGIWRQGGTAQNKETANKPLGNQQVRQDQINLLLKKANSKDLMEEDVIEIIKWKYGIDALVKLKNSQYVELMNKLPELWDQMARRPK